MIMRHNNLRDVNAEFQKEVCHDVKVEPMLIPIEGENTQIEGAKEDGAHPDISSRGLWSPFERTFYDVQVIHPNSPSYLDTTPKIRFTIMPLWASHSIIYSNCTITFKM